VHKRKEKAMTSILDELWESYRDNHPFMENEEEKRVVAQLAECGSELKSMSEVQRATAEKMGDCWAELCSISEREAFRVGFRFAAMLWNEVFSQERKEP
jgi:hypothetical protein